MIGDKYKLKTAMLGVPRGSIGIVFNEYEDFSRIGTGIQLIFENGNYDGFSVQEQNLFLERVGFESRYSTYRFKNVMQVSRDFMEGYWKWEK